jgi:hypothetical protein
MNWRDEFEKLAEYQKRPDTSELDRQINEVRERYFDLCSKPLRLSSEPKIIIKQEIPDKQKKAIINNNGLRDKSEKYVLRYQSLVTGRQSQQLRYKEMDDIGIRPEYLITGGGYPDNLPMWNNYEIVESYYMKFLQQLFDRKYELLKNYYQNRNQDWWDLYNAYLFSSQWENTRQARLMMDSYRCQMRLSGCTYDEHLQVHHESYDNIGDEPMDDLLTVCHNCHQLIHGREF